MYLILRWLVNTMALILVAFFIQGIHIKSYYSALMAALVLGIVNAILKPILVILTLPINILTLGLFTLFINGLMFWFVASFVKGFEIVNFSAAFWGAVVYSIITWITHMLTERK